jgi:hypothetical protein
MHTNKITQGKKDEIIKKYRNFIENNYVNRKLQIKWVVIRATSACGRVRLY